VYCSESRFLSWASASGVGLGLALEYDLAHTSSHDRVFLGEAGDAGRQLAMRSLSSSRAFNNLSTSAFGGSIDSDLSDAKENPKTFLITDGKTTTPPFCIIPVEC
jgi:hypothetical protein